MNSRYYFLPTIVTLLLIAIAFKVYQVEMRKEAVRIAEATVERFERIDCQVARVDSLYACKAAEVSYNCTGNQTIMWDRYWPHQKKADVNWSRDSFRSAVTKEFSLNSTEVFYDGRKCCGEKLYIQSRPPPTDLNIYKDNKTSWASAVALIVAVVGLGVGSFIEFAYANAYHFCLATGKQLTKPGQVSQRMSISGLGVVLAMVLIYVVSSLEEY